MLDMAKVLGLRQSKIYQSLSPKTGVMPATAIGQTVSPSSALDRPFVLRRIVFRLFVMIEAVL